MSAKRRRTRSVKRQQRLAGRVQSVETPLGLIGFGGDQNTWDSLTPGEYNPNLRGLEAQRVYRRMVAEDPQVRGVCRVVDIPIRAARWRVEPYKAKTSLDVQVADFVEQNLFDGMDTTWDDTIRLMCGAVPFGCSVLEKEFVQVRGQVRLAGLWDRVQTTIERFEYDDRGRLAAVHQVGTRADGSAGNERITADRLLVTTFEGHGGSVAGSPLCRPMYMPWFVKHPVIKLIGVGLENSLVGTVWAKVPRTMTPADRAALKTAIEDLRVRDATGFVLDADVVLDILEGKRNPLDALPLIEYLDLQIARVALAQWLNLGGGSGSGSRAVSEDHSRMFLEGLNAIANMLEDALNRYLIPQLVGYNWPGLTQFPRIRHADLKRLLTLASVGDALNKLSTGGLLTWTEDVENTIRDWFDMDPLPEGFARQSAPPAPPENAGAPGDGTPVPDGTGQPAQNPSARSLPSAAMLTHNCSHDGVELAARGQAAPLLDQVGDAFQAQAREILEDMIARLRAAAEPLLRAAGDDAGGLHRANVYPVLARLSLPRHAELAELLRGYMDDVIAGALAAAAQVAGDTPQLDLEALRRFAYAEADLLARRIPEQLHVAYLQSFLDGTSAEVTDDQLLGDAAQAARDRLQSDFAGGFAAAITSITSEVQRQLQAPHEAA